MKNSITKSFLLLLVALSCIQFSCAEDDDTSGQKADDKKEKVDDKKEKVDVTVTLWGESGVEDKTDFVDDYLITYSSYKVTLGKVFIVDNTGKETELTLANPEFEIKTDTHEKGVEVAKTQLPAGKYSVHFQIKKVEMVGEAIKIADGDDQYTGQTSRKLKSPKEKKTFHWTFEPNYDFKGCEAKLLDGKEDADVLHDGKTYRIEIHADHLWMTGNKERRSKKLDAWYVMKFEPFAKADKDNNGKITKDELEQADAIKFQKNKAANLWTHLEERATTLGHVNNGKHCHDSRPIQLSRME